jgi:hypothetical protein
VGLGIASVGCAASLALSTATSAGAANTALMVNGLGAGDLNFLEMAGILGGMFGSYQRINVSWPQQARPITGANSLLLGESIDIGADNLDTALTSALAQLKPGERVTLVGLSAGALVVNEELRRLLADPDAPAKNKLNAVVIADSSRMLFNQSGKNKHLIGKILKYTYPPPLVTAYDTTVVTAEYDGFADFPDRPKPIAVLNAVAGAALTHVPAMLTNLSTVPSSNVKVTTNSLGGVTTSYLLPAAQLPLVRLIPALKPREAELKKVIDSAYSRNDDTASVSPAAVSPAAVTSAAVSGANDLTGSDRSGSARRSATSKSKPAAAERGSKRRSG